MAKFTFNLPDIGEGIAEAEIVAWHVKPGDVVEVEGELADDAAAGSVQDAVAAASEIVAEEPAETRHHLSSANRQVRSSHPPQCGHWRRNWAWTLPMFGPRRVIAFAMAIWMPSSPMVRQADMITRHGAVHLGLATITKAGLMVPVIRDAQALNLWQLTTEILRLSKAARTGKAKPEELSGSTFTITSLGPLGGDSCDRPRGRWL